MQVSRHHARARGRVVSLASGSRATPLLQLRSAVVALPPSRPYPLCASRRQRSAEGSFSCSGLYEARWGSEVLHLLPHLKTLPFSCLTIPSLTARIESLGVAVCHTRLPTVLDSRPGDRPAAGHLGIRSAGQQHSVSSQHSVAHGLMTSTRRLSCSLVLSLDSLPLVAGECQMTECKVRRVTDIVGHRTEAGPKPAPDVTHSLCTQAVLAAARGLPGRRDRDPGPGPAFGQLAPRPGHTRVFTVSKSSPSASLRPFRLALAQR